MDVVVFAVAYDQLRFNVFARISENLSQVLNGAFGAYIPMVFGDKDKVSMQAENAMPAGAIFVCCNHTNEY